jgi:putative ABC transport system permease protein
MKYFSVVWAALFRRRSRAILTILSIAAAFLLFGLLDTVRSSFAVGNSADGAGRLISASRMSMQQPLPASLAGQMKTVPGVVDVASANWFGGVYQQPENQVVAVAVSPNYIDLYPEIVLPAAQRSVYEKTRTGAVVGAELARQYGWKVGDRIPLQSTLFAPKSGGNAWSFQISGIFHSKDPRQGGWDRMMLFHWDYFDEMNAFGPGTVHWYVIRVADPARADSVAHAIDRLSENSDHETKTQSEQSFQASFVKQMVNIGLIVTSIMGAVFFTLLLLTGNMMMQAIRERTSELAVMKTLGFTSRRLMAMVIGESVLLMLIGGSIGMGLVTLIAPKLAGASRGLMAHTGVGIEAWGVGLLLMLAIGVLVGLLPGMRAMRLNIVDALAEH